MTKRKRQKPRNFIRGAAERADRIFLYGLHPVRAALSNEHRHLARIYATSETREKLGASLPAQGRRRLETIEIREVERRELDRMLEPGTVHQGVAAEAAPLNQPRLEDAIAESPADALVMVLDQVTDPQNVGAILRSAAVFGAFAVVTTERNAPEESGTLAKASAGAIERVPYIRVTNLARALDGLKAAGFWTVGLAGDADAALQDVDLGSRLAVVMGAEGSGLRRLTREACDLLVRIPAPGLEAGAGDEPVLIDSLNVSTAAAVTLYELLSRRRRPS